MPLHKGKIRGIFIKVIFIYPRHQATHYVKLTLMISHTASAVDYLLNGMTGKFSERSSIVNIHPRICLTDRLIELSYINCDIYFPIVKAKISMVVIYRHLMKKLTCFIGFYQLIRPTPINVLLLIHADPL